MQVLAVLLLSLPRLLAAQPSSQDTLGVHQAIINYHEGFSSGDSLRVSSAIGSSFYMFNGNRSGRPRDWQAHQYLTDEDLRRWPGFMIRNAGPFENRYDFVHTSVRGASALVVTRERGRNRFREWSDELVTWMLGRDASGWRIVGLFIRDAANP